MRRELFPEPVEDRRENLYQCPEPDCKSELVEPVDWKEAQDEHGESAWQLICHCPNCFWVGEGIHSNDKVRELEDRLDDGLSNMLRDLRKVTDANMYEMLDRFITALQAGHILPEDF